MLIKIDWATPNSDGHKMYHMYQVNEYFVEVLDSITTHLNEELPQLTRLMLDNDKHDIVLSNGDSAYIMNDSGKTVDIVRTCKTQKLGQY